MTATSLPQSIINNPRPDRWIHFDPQDRSVRLSVGKVEIGQGVLTALAQIAAEELDVDLGRIRVVSGDTERAPDEGSTSSSLSIEVSGASVRLISAEVRGRILDRIAQRLNCAPDDITVVDGAFFLGNNATGQDYWTFAPQTDLTRNADGSAPHKPVTRYKLVGTPARRIDLPGKLTGGAFIQDMIRPDMLHARIVRQPSREARLAALDEGALHRAARGDLRILRLGNFLALLSPDETVAQRAAVAAPAHARWENLRPTSPEQQEAAWLIGKSSDDRTLGAPLSAVEGETVEATYSRPYIAHAALAPACALAESRNGHLTVWSHTQAIYPLRTALAKILGRPESSITARHVPSAGCYGHNGADDVALDAALIAREIADHCIRVQWRREQEFAFERYGPAQVVTVRAVLDANRRPKDWTAEIWAASHVQRPAMGGNMLAHEALPEPPPPARPFEPPEAAGGGGTRNAFPLYDIPAKRVIHHLALDPPLRTSALRSLGAMANVFALESMMDELAERAGEDPVVYRLSIMSEPRARRVIKRAAEMASWSDRGPAGTGTGLGIGFAQYKNRSAYAAVVVALDVEQEVRLRYIWAAADGGLIINPDGALNQLEGGIIQAASFTLKEQVKLGHEGVTSLDWDTYPILRFSEVPEITCELIDARDHSSLGMGECTIGPTAAAIGNAVAHALGTRIRDLPLTRERVAAALVQG
jgi:nicotinate dehydrogenase subunit B